MSSRYFQADGKTGQLSFFVTFGAGEARYEKGRQWRPQGKNVYCVYSSTLAESFCRRDLMSSALQAVVRGPIFTGLGYRPFLHPAHHALRLTGINFSTCGKRSSAALSRLSISLLLLCMCLRFCFRLHDTLSGEPDCSYWNACFPGNFGI